MKIADFTTFFLGIPRRRRRAESIDIYHVEAESGASTSAARIESEVQYRRARLRMVLGMNWIVSAVCISSFVGVMVFAFLYPAEDVPDVIQNAFSVTLGYFVSAVVSFLEGRSVALDSASSDS